MPRKFLANFLFLSLVLVFQFYMESLTGYCGKILEKSNPISGREVAQKIFDRDNGEDFVAKMKMVLINKNGRKRVREFYSYEKDYGRLIKQLIRFVSPEDIAGTGFLSVEKDIGETHQFLYLPALRRSRRIVSTQKFRRFVNSDFTYEDMERKRVDDYFHTLMGSESRDGFACYVLESKPKQGIRSQYGSIKNWVVKDIFVPIYTEFYDKKGDLVKKYTVKKLSKVQGIWTEMLVEMEDLTRFHKTLLEVIQVRYNTGVKDSIFTRRFLEKW